MEEDTAVFILGIVITIFFTIIVIGIGINWHYSIKSDIVIKCMEKHTVSECKRGIDD